MPANPLSAGEFLTAALRERYTIWLSNEIQTLLHATYRDLASTLANDYATLTPYQHLRLRQLQQQIAQYLDHAYIKVAAKQAAEVRQLATIEASHAYGIIAARVDGIPALAASLQFLSPTRVAAVADFPISGLTLGEWWQKQAAGLSDVTRVAIQRGLLMGEPMSTIVKRLVPDPIRPVDATVWRAATIRARTLVRTSSNAISNYAALAQYQEAGSDVTDRYRWRSVLDGRTSTLCRSLDGQIFYYNDPKAPIPPAHPNCRSTIIPLLNIGGLDTATRKAAMQSGFGTDGDTSGKQPDYKDWFAQQDTAVQATVLGQSNLAKYQAGAPLDALAFGQAAPLTPTQYALALKTVTDAGGFSG